MDRIDAARIASDLGEAKRSGKGWVAQCPAHDDSSPSLSLTDVDDKILVRCHAGCTQSSVFSALRARGLWSGSDQQEHVYNYVDSAGELVYQVVRKPGKKFQQRRQSEDGRIVYNLEGVKPLPYGLPHVIEAVRQGKEVFIVEGEKDAERLIALGLVATTNSGGAGKWTPAHSEHLQGCVQVNILPDNDKAGASHAASVADSLMQQRVPVKVVCLPGLPNKGDVSNWLDTGGTKEALLCLAEQTPRWEPSAPEAHFGDPILFESQKLAEIDSTFLPEPIKAFVDAVADQTQTPVAMAAMLALAVIASCVQKTARVRPTDGTYAEPLSLWVLVAMPPASRKTAVLQALLQPVLQWEREQSQSLSPIIEKAKIEHEISVRRCDELMRSATKQDDPQMRQQIQAEIIALTEQRKPIPSARRVFVNDTTSEAFQTELAENEGRSAVISDEGATFQIWSGLYSDGKSNFDVFLQGHAGGPVRVKRRDRYVQIDGVAVSLGLAVQPQVLADLGSRSRKSFRGRGLLARFLYCSPPSNIGRRDVRTVKPVPTAAQREYASCIRAMLDVPISEDAQLLLTPEALSTWHDFAEWIERQQGAGGMFEEVQDFTGKLPGQALRISALCHIARNFKSLSPSSPLSLAPIDAETVRNSVELCKALISHALSIFTALDEDDTICDAIFAWSWVKQNFEVDEQGQPFFRRNSLHASSRFRKSKVARVEKATQILVERNLIHEIQHLPTRCRWRSKSA